MASSDWSCHAPGVPVAPPERIELAALTLRRSTEAEAQQERLRHTLAAWERGSDFEFLVVRRGEDLPVLGVFGLHRTVGPRAIELGYWLAVGVTGRGYATAAARALTDAALGIHDVDSVEIHCDQANERSQRVPERLGYRLDRIEDDDVKAPGEVGRSMIWVYPA